MQIQDWIGHSFLELLLFAIPAILILVPLYFLGQGLIFYGRRMRVPDADTLLAKDHRPPILYLRSFRDDEAGLQSPGSDGVFFGTWEERLVRALGKYGPVVAIGRPGEPEPPLGAARLYVRDDEDWRTQVLERMANALLVVVQIGDSEGLWWELATAVRILPPERLVLYIPERFQTISWSAFRQRALILFPAGLPADVKYVVFVYFGPDGVPKVITSKYIYAADTAFGRPTSYLIGARRLRPIFDQLKTSRPVSNKGTDG